MKTRFPLLATLFCLLLLNLFGCQDHKLDPTTSDTCKLTVIDRGNGNKHTYAYDAQGRITQMTREFDGFGTGTISHYVYVFTYDGAGLLTKSIITLEGKPYGTETYAYTNGRISKVTYNNVDGSKGVHNITYNAAGQITEFTYDSGDPTEDGKDYFEYNADGVMINHGFADLQGRKLYESRFKPVGKIKSPEQLLAAHGLPFDVRTGFSWAVAEGGEGSTYEYFSADDKTGKLVQDGSEKITATKTNATGYLTEVTFVEDNNDTSTQIYTLADCN